MKKKQTGFALALLFLGGLGMVNGSLPREPAQPPDQRLAISQYGTLLEVFDANGQSLLGKLGGDGFQVSYQAHGKFVSASAMGATANKRLVGGQVHLDGPSATVTAITSDQTLEITSRFILDENDPHLFIERRVKNISNETVKLQMARSYVDTKLVRRGPKTRHTNLRRIALELITAGSCLICDCNAGKCTPPPPPPCLQVWCPGQDGYLPSQMIAGPSGGGRQITLQWKGGKTSASRTPAATTIGPGQTVHYVVLLKLH